MSAIAASQYSNGIDCHFDPPLVFIFAGFSLPQKIGNVPVFA